MVDRARVNYHHGALRQALVQAGLDMARTGGADAVVLREATRRAGVTARAAYRHFSDRAALVHAVAGAALAEMVDRIVAAQQGTTDPAELLRRVGLGYIAFARDEPGWFDVAFFSTGEFVDPEEFFGSGNAAPAAADETDHAGGTALGVVDSSGPRTPYTPLQQALHLLVSVGLLTPDRVESAALLCWSGVHGFATLASRGPLASLPIPAIDERARCLLDDLVTAVIVG